MFRRGRFYSGSTLMVRVLPNGLGWSRLGVVAGKKVGSAVERNRAKRRIREAVNIRAMPLGWDVVVIARTSIRSAEYRDLERELRQLLVRAGVLNASGCGVDRPCSHIPEDHI